MSASADGNSCDAAYNQQHTNKIHSCEGDMEEEDCDEHRDYRFQAGDHRTFHGPKQFYLQFRILL